MGVGSVQALLRALLELRPLSWEPVGGDWKGPSQQAEQTLEKEIPDSPWTWRLSYHLTGVTGCKGDSCVLMSPLCLVKRPRGF